RSPAPCCRWTAAGSPSKGAGQDDRSGSPGLCAGRCRSPISRDSPRRSMSKAPKPINLALQGGGAHGAFTWGVLDWMLESRRFTVEGISGTSAGAMNAVVLADGFHKGGEDGAREALERFWKAVSDQAWLSPL